MRALGGREDLHRALEQTYTAHVTNMLQHVLLLDLFREIGGLILDPDKRSASLLRAFSALRDTELMEELRAEHAVVRPAIHIGAELPPEVWEQFEAERKDRDRREQLERLERDLSELGPLEEKIRSADVAERLWTIRSKGIAHYKVVHEGPEWKLWAEDGTQTRVTVTWGEINDYMDACTRSVELLYGVACHTSFSFEDAKVVSQGNVDEFIDALRIGLTDQKQRREQERQEALARRREEHGI